MNLATRAELEHAAELVYSVMQPTPQHCWPSSNARRSPFIQPSFLDRSDLGSVLESNGPGGLLG